MSCCDDTRDVTHRGDLSRCRSCRSSPVVWLQYPCMSLSALFEEDVSMAGYVDYLWMCSCLIKPIHPLARYIRTGPSRRSLARGHQRTWGGENLCILRAKSYGQRKPLRATCQQGFLVIKREPQSEPASCRPSGFCRTAS